MLVFSFLFPFILSLCSYPAHTLRPSPNVDCQAGCGEGGGDCMVAGLAGGQEQLKSVSLVHAS